MEEKIENPIQCFINYHSPRNEPAVLRITTHFLREKNLVSPEIDDSSLICLCTNAECKVMPENSIICVQGRNLIGSFVLLEGEVGGYGTFENSTCMLLKSAEQSDGMIKRLESHALHHFLGSKIKLFVGPTLFGESMYHGKEACYSCVCHTECVVLFIRKSLYHDCLEKFHRKDVLNHISKIDLLKSMRMCRGWSNARLCQTADELSPEQIDCGETLHFQMTKLTKIFIICSGELKMMERFIFNAATGEKKRQTKALPRLDEQEIQSEVCMARRGCFIGDIEMVRKSKFWMYTTVAQEKSELYSISLENFVMFFMRPTDEHNSLQILEEATTQNHHFFEQKIDNICTNFWNGLSGKGKILSSQHSAPIQVTHPQRDSLKKNFEKQPGLQPFSSKQEMELMDLQIEIEQRRAKAMTQINTARRATVQAVPSLSRTGAMQAITVGLNQTQKPQYTSSTLIDHVSVEKIINVNQKCKAFETTVAPSCAFDTLVGVPQKEQYVFDHLKTAVASSNFALTGNVQVSANYGQSLAALVNQLDIISNRPSATTALTSRKLYEEEPHCQNNTMHQLQINLPQNFGTSIKPSSIQLATTFQPCTSRSRHIRSSNHSAITSEDQDEKNVEICPPMLRNCPYKGHSHSFKIEPQTQFTASQNKPVNLCRRQTIQSTSSFISNEQSERNWGSRLECNQNLEMIKISSPINLKEQTPSGHGAFISSKPLSFVHKSYSLKDKAIDEKIEDLNRQKVGTGLRMPCMELEGALPSQNLFQQQTLQNLRRSSSCSPKCTRGEGNRQSLQPLKGAMHTSDSKKDTAFLCTTDHAHSSGFNRRQTLQSIPNFDKNGFLLAPVPTKNKSLLKNDIHILRQSSNPHMVAHSTLKENHQTPLKRQTSAPHILTAHSLEKEKATHKIENEGSLVNLNDHVVHSQMDGSPCQTKKLEINSCNSQTKSSHNLNCKHREDSKICKHSSTPLFVLKIKAKEKMCSVNFFEGQTPNSVAEQFLVDNNLQDDARKDLYVEALEEEIRKRLIKMSGNI